MPRKRAMSSDGAKQPPLAPTPVSDRLTLGRILVSAFRGTGLGS